MSRHGGKGSVCAFLTAMFEAATATAAIRSGKGASFQEAERCVAFWRRP
jgi:hypothetical protein